MVKLVVFDMAGTTVSDKNEVEKCFVEAADATNLKYNVDQIVSMMGWSKRLVFETLWKQNIPDAGEGAIQKETENSYQKFKNILENHYLNEKVTPTEGTLEIFDFLRSQNIKIALTTGFYRKVTDIILNRLGWDKGLDSQYKGNSSSIIDLSISSDQVKQGRPAPDMIYKAMEMLGVGKSEEVIKIGDTPSDLLAGKNAGCLLSLGVTNGTHTQSKLEKFDNDGLLPSISGLRKTIELHL